MDGGLEIAEIQAGHLELRRIGRRKTASDPQSHVSYGAGRAVRKGFCAKAYVLPACLVQQRQHVLKAPEHQHLHGLVRVGQEAQQPIHQRRQPVLLENVQRHVGQTVHQSELGGSLRFLQALQERFQIVDAHVLLTVREQAGRDDLQGVGDADGVLRGDPAVGMETHIHVPLPQLHGLRQQGRCGGHRRFLGRGQGQFLAVVGAAVGQNGAHDPGRLPPHVPLMVHEELVEEAQHPPLVGARHIGAELLEDPQIGPYPVQILLAPGPLQQLAEAHVLPQVEHQPDIVFDGLS